MIGTIVGTKEHLILSLSIKVVLARDIVLINRSHSATEKEDIVTCSTQAVLTKQN